MQVSLLQKVVCAGEPAVEVAQLSTAEAAQMLQEQDHVEHASAPIAAAIELAPQMAHGETAGSVICFFALIAHFEHSFLC